MNGRTDGEASGSHSHAGEKEEAQSPDAAPGSHKSQQLPATSLRWPQDGCSFTGGVDGSQTIGNETEQPGKILGCGDLGHQWSLASSKEQNQPSENYIK
ncbi:hypothetical protein llap_6588 [Limosa lapponica baueri]|uniref:Uncharacterized protein n=1 Tax=Limosa lapponica baueri TaxID=1758121 RepID=A0A2I0UAN2_LIMLA|nr:hypothetical protein llap_6588 [Limosa lapponica baueri]